MKLLETIKIQDGKIFNLSYHQQRCNASRLKLFKAHKALDLASIINPPSKGLFRCRIVYDKKLHSIEYIPYQAKEIQSLQLISSSLDYTYKYENREEINALVRKCSKADDIIIEKNGYITDTSIANIAFYDGQRWFSPKRPLLYGTMRQKLLDEGFLIEKDIKKSQISSYTHIALMNAMLGFKILKTPKILS